MNRRVLVIDGNLLIHKSHHVFRKLSVTIDGNTIHTGVAYGFLKGLVRLNKLYSPCETCIVFDNSMNVTAKVDHSEKSYREEILPEYKEGRSHNNELVADVRLLFRFLKTLPVTIMYPSVKYEADDVVSFVVKRAFKFYSQNKKSKFEIIIVSEDKDFNQLIQSTNGFSVKIHKKNDKLWDEKIFRKKFCFSPDRFVSYLSLLGDKGDNISGVHGYGKVKSAEAARNYRPDEIPKKILSEEEAEIYNMNVVLISLVSNDDVIWRIFEPELDKSKFNFLARKYKMTSFLRKEDQKLLGLIKNLSFLWEEKIK